jgi:hypothetical protein
MTGSRSPERESASLVHVARVCRWSVTLAFWVALPAACTHATHRDAAAPIIEIAPGPPVSIERSDAVQQRRPPPRQSHGGLIELARILTPGLSATPRELQPEPAPNMRPDPSWDPHRLWLRSYRQTDRELRITGEAIAAEDVAELLRRMSLSAIFSDILLQSAQTAANLSSITFEIKARCQDPLTADLSSASEAAPFIHEGVRNPFSR